LRAVSQQIFGGNCDGRALRWPVKELATGNLSMRVKNLPINYGRLDHQNVPPAHLPEHRLKRTGSQQAASQQCSGVMEAGGSVSADTTSAPRKAQLSETICFQKVRDCTENVNV
jgi:hypothetical protein